MRKLLVLGFFLVALAAQARAEEAFLLGGANRENSLSETTYAWTAEFAHDLESNRHLAFAWINEGHLTGHHRDGPTVRFSQELDFADRGPSLDLGIGPYAYFDTVRATEGASYANDHGLGLIYSVGLSWPAFGRWQFHLRANRIETDGPIDTTSLLFGGRYRFAEALASSESGARGQHPKANTAGSEVTIFLGGTILNSFTSETSAASAFEYRRGLGSRHVDWTLGLLHEGAHEVIRRNGLTSQVWLVQPAFEGRLTLGVGGGAYFALSNEDRVGNDEGDEPLAALLTVMASYRFGSQWFSRILLNRVMTDYSRDTDVILIGLGHRF